MYAFISRLLYTTRCWNHWDKKIELLIIIIIIIINGNIPPWEADTRADNQQMPCLFWNPKVNYRVLKDIISSQLNSTHNRAMLFKFKLNGVLPPLSYIQVD
jgi:hypothetical protein